MRDEAHGTERKLKLGPSKRTVRKAAENAEKPSDYITDTMVVAVGIAGAVCLFSWFHFRRGETRAKRQAVEGRRSVIARTKARKAQGFA